MSFLYHPDKANVVADAVSWITMCSVSHSDKSKKELAREVHRFSRLGMRFDSALDEGDIVYQNSESSLMV